MAYFLGTHRNKVDAKGRVSLPAAFRDTILKEDPDAKRIAIIPPPGQVRLDGSDLKFVFRLADAVSIPGNNSDADRLSIRRLLSRMRELTIDDTGRVLFSSELLQHAGIDTEAVFYGIGNTFHVFSPAGHDAFERDLEAQTGNRTLGLADAPHMLKSAG